MQLRDNKFSENAGTCKTKDRDICDPHLTVPEHTITWDEPSASFTRSPLVSGMYFTNDLLEPAMCRDAPKSTNHKVSAEIRLAREEVLPVELANDVEASLDFLASSLA